MVSPPEEGAAGSVAFGGSPIPSGLPSEVPSEVPPEKAVEKAVEKTREGVTKVQIKKAKPPPAPDRTVQSLPVALVALSCGATIDVSLSAGNQKKNTRRLPLIVCVFFFVCALCVCVCAGGQRDA